MIDLHSHTTASDGQYPPEEQVARAAQAGVKVLAITDHDTVDGLQAAQPVAQARGMRLIPGIEISISVNRREVHILGHFVDPQAPQLRDFSAQLKIERESRMREMVHKLQRLGFPITMDMVNEVAHGALLTRPHLARVMVEFGYCKSLPEAFSRFLGDGKPAHVRRVELGAKEAIALIHSAGGTATVAHPGSTKINHAELKDLKAAELDGIEVIHFDHPPSKREQLLKWALEFDLIATAGSDFHGEQIAPDRMFGKLTMSNEALASLEARRR